MSKHQIKFAMLKATIMSIALIVYLMLIHTLAQAIQ